MPDVTIVTASARRLAALAHKGPYPEMSKAFERLSEIVTAHGLWDQGRGMAGVFHDDPQTIPAPELRSHAGMLLADGAVVPEGLEELVLPAGDTAVMEYVGPYSGLPAAYDEIYGRWLPQSGRQPSPQSSYEIYLKGPMDAEPEAMITQICVPLIDHSV